MKLASGANVPISKVRPGDKVMATDPSTGKTGAETVTAVWVRQDSDLMDVIVQKGGQRSRIHATAKHLFWDQSRRRWTEVRSLHAGDLLMTDDGTVVTVVGTLSVPGVRYMWDLTVADAHDFFVVAGSAVVLVHNVPNCNLEQDLTVPDYSTIVVGYTASDPGAVQTSGEHSGAFGDAQSDAEQGVSYRRVRVTTAGAIRASGGTVQYIPGLTAKGEKNYQHVNIYTPDASVFGRMQDVGVPRADQIGGKRYPSVQMAGGMPEGPGPVR